VTVSAWYVCSYWPIVPAPDDDECGVVGGMLGCTATLSTTNPTCCDPGLRGGKPTNNRLKYGTIYRNWLRHYYTSRKVACSRPNEVNFYTYLILPAALGPGVYSASNRNEYQKHKNKNVFGE
jgi:hypothetical protein